MKINQKVAAKFLEDGNRAFGFEDSETEKILDYVAFITNGEKKFYLFWFYYFPGFQGTHCTVKIKSWNI